MAFTRSLRFERMSALQRRQSPVRRPTAFPLRGFTTALNEPFSFAVSVRVPRRTWIAGRNRRCLDVLGPPVVFAPRNESDPVGLRDSDSAGLRRRLGVDEIRRRSG